MSDPVTGEGALVMEPDSLDERRWAAVRERVKSDFVFAVRTTRVACRPGCPSRTPARSNVAFFDDFASAQRAGYRACKRCLPEASDPDSSRRAAVERACRAFANDEELGIEEAAAAAGLSRFHFQRVFREVTGVTPGQYRRALRDERFRALLKSEKSVTDAIAAAGFGSASRAYASDALGMIPSVFRSGGHGETLRYAGAACTLGRVVVAVTPRGIASVELAATDREGLARLRERFPHAQLEPAGTSMAQTLQAVVEAIDDPRSQPSLELDARGTAFQRRVWNALRAVPAGSRITYQELAAAAGAPGAAQAAGAACAANRHAVLIPCHRAVRKDGDLAGYRWGIERKTALLERERNAESTTATEMETPADRRAEAASPARGG